MQRWSRALVATMTVPLLMGCYAYTDIDSDPSTVPVGATVRVGIDRQEAVRQLDVLGGLEERVEGQVTEQTNGSGLAMTVRHSATPAEGGRFNAFVIVPWSSVNRVELKRFSVVRTGAIVAGGAAVAAVVLSVLEGSSKPGDGEPPNTQDAVVSVPLLRLRW